jgi:RNA polymerase sigma factor (sigma-70 family)
MNLPQSVEDAGHTGPGGMRKDSSRGHTQREERIMGRRSRFNDPKFLDALQSDNEEVKKEACAELYREMREPLCSFIYTRPQAPREREKVEELVHDVFERAFAAITNFKRMSTIESWLFGIAKNVVKDANQKDARENRWNGDPGVIRFLLEFPGSPQSPETLVSNRELWERAIQWVEEEFGPIYVRILTMKYQGLSEQKIADEVGLSLGTVSSYWSQIKKLLRRYL